jgi:hypothetical protein
VNSASGLNDLITGITGSGIALYYIDSSDASNVVAEQAFQSDGITPYNFPKPLSSTTSFYSATYQITLDSTKNIASAPFKILVSEGATFTSKLDYTYEVCK